MRRGVSILSTIVVVVLLLAAAAIGVLRRAGAPEYADGVGPPRPTAPPSGDSTASAPPPPPTTAPPPPPPPPPPTTAPPPPPPPKPAPDARPPARGGSAGRQTSGERTRPRASVDTPTTAGADAPPPAPPLPPSGLPAFPWPPPRYSAFAPIAREWVAIGDQPTLASGAARLERAFDAAGYGERSYYWVPGGFALVSRLEQIGPDATPLSLPARWAVDTPAVRGGFIDHIRALFNAAPGFYRVIVFIVTDQDFAAGERTPTSSEARTWISSGAMRLPASVGAQPYTPHHYTTALIYEFERPADLTEPRMRMPSMSQGQVHLAKTGLWQALASLR